MTSIIRTLVCGSLLTLVAAASNAATVTFTFDKNVGATSGSAYFASDDGSRWLRATPWSESGAAALRGCAVCGLFVITDGAADDNTAIDGSGPNEAVLLELLGAKDGTLLSATFRQADANDNFNLFVNGSEVLSDVPVGLGPVATYVFAGDQLFSGKEFGFLAGGSDDDFKLWQVAFEVAEVPLPGTLGLLGLGLVGLGAARRKQKV